MTTKTTKRPVGRPRSAGSKESLMHLGLEPTEDAKLLRLLKAEDNMSLRSLLRNLVRKWMQDKELM